jgi:hypothetical protein
LVVKSGILQPLVKNLRFTKSLSMLKICSYTFLNLTRDAPAYDIQTLDVLIGSLRYLCGVKNEQGMYDEEILGDVSWAISYLTDNNDDALIGVAR